jgi:hypothetical protein
MAFASLVAITDDSELDLVELKRFVMQVEKTIHHQANDVRYAMNRFVIAVGTYVGELTERALEAAEKIGPVSVDFGDTACQCPLAPEHIQKAKKDGVVGKKRKSAKC